MPFHWSFYCSLPLAVAYFLYPFYILKAAPIWACAIASYLQYHRYGRWICLGLLFGSAGDILLEMDAYYGLDLFIPGLIAFLFGHLCYIRAFYHAVRPFNTERCVGLVTALCYYGPVIGLLLSRVSYMMMGPIAVYAFVLVSMAFFAYNRFLLSHQLPLPTRSLCLIGALFFLASDSLLSFNAFYESYAGSGWLVMVTYYIAQGLVAASAQCELDIENNDILGDDHFDSFSNKSVGSPLNSNPLLV